MRRIVLVLSALAALAATLVLATSSVAGVLGPTVLVTPLSGQEEIDEAGQPGAGDLDGFGFAIIRINTETSQVCWTLLVRGIELPATAAHIHQAPAGVNGDIVVPLSPPVGGVGFLGRLGFGFSNGCVSSDAAGSIASDPDAFYVNVHNEPFPAGAVRGQL